jgi:hypothetical protein
MANIPCEVCESIERVTKYHVEYGGVGKYRVRYGRIDRTVALCPEHSKPIRDILAATRTRQLGPSPYIPADEVARRGLGVVKPKRRR